jgi:hypothetical protein
MPSDLRSIALRKGLQQDRRAVAERVPAIACTYRKTSAAARRAARANGCLRTPSERRETVRDAKNFWPRAKVARRASDGRDEGPAREGAEKPGRDNHCLTVIAIGSTLWKSRFQSVAALGRGYSGMMESAAAFGVMRHTRRLQGIGRYSKFREIVSVRQDRSQRCRGPTGG